MSRTGIALTFLATIYGLLGPWAVITSRSGAFSYAVILPMLTAIFLTIVLKLPYKFFDSARSRGVSYLSILAGCIAGVLLTFSVTRRLMMLFLFVWIIVGIIYLVRHLIFTTLHLPAARRAAAASAPSAAENADQPGQ